MTLKKTPLADAIGIEIEGLDMSAPLNEADAAALRAALAEHLLVVIRGQKLSPSAFLAAVRHVGSPMRQHMSSVLMEDHPEIAVLDSRKAPKRPDGTVNAVGSVTWHTDHTNHERPPAVTCLYAVAMPKVGGTTGFANMQTAFEDLPEDEREELLSLKTVNTFRNRRGFITDEDMAKYDRECVHPLIRTHPGTGRKAIYVHWNQMDRLEGQDSEASRAFIKELIDRTVTPEITYRHHWQVGDLVFIDNMGAMHKAMRDYQHTETRILHRIILEGGVPY